MATKKGKGGTGPENYDPNTGQYIKEGSSSDSNIDTTHMTEKEIENHNKDKTINVPHFEKNFVPFLKELLSRYSTKVTLHSVEEMDKYSPGLTERLDKQGIDYVINNNGKWRTIDLKSIQPFNGILSTMITLPIEKFDSKVYDKSKKVQGKHVADWFAKDNFTDNLAFQFLTESNYESPEAFIIGKTELKQTIFKNYFEDYASNIEETFERLRNEFVTAKNQILNQNVDISKYGFYPSYEDKKVSYISKTFASKKYGHITAKMKFEYTDDGKVNHSLVLLCPKKYLKKQIDYVSLNREEKEKHDASKLFGEVL